MNRDNDTARSRFRNVIAPFLELTKRKPRSAFFDSSVCADGESKIGGSEENPTYKESFFQPESIDGDSPGIDDGSSV